ncbi:hypothetical protein BDV96DRAFT_579859 [Lophiotrema nucula]|uniref:Uncharacterized protein n=1 Tax=Lophiotrema nucula TaxID=690887 RepID=A0A6A5YZB6_9PLEO|nr:hypothetical protein BDV96DRAFT_579859 [Lophiotrema nucula]
MAREIYIIIQSSLASPTEESRPYKILKVFDYHCAVPRKSFSDPVGYSSWIEVSRVKLHKTEDEILIVLEAFQTPFDYATKSSVHIAGAANNKADAAERLKEVISEQKEKWIYREATEEELESMRRDRSKKAMNRWRQTKADIEKRLVFDPQYRKDDDGIENGCGIEDSKWEKFFSFDIVKVEVGDAT